MAYIPSAKDLDSWSSQPEQQGAQGGGYVPSAQDLDQWSSNSQQQAQPQQQAPAPQESGGFLQRMFSPMAHVGAGLATSGRNTLNMLQDAGRSVGIDSLMGKVPGLKDVTRPESDRTYDYYKALGLDENAADKAAVAVADFAPYMIGGSGAVKAGSKLLAESPKLAEKAAAFASKNPYTSKFLTNMAENAPAGAAYTAAHGGDQKESLLAATAASALPVAAQPLIKYGAKAYAQSAIPAFTKKATDSLRSGLAPLEEYAQSLFGKFKGADTLNKSNWKGLEKTAAELDKNVLMKTPEQRAADEVNKLGGKLFDKSQGEVPPIAKSLHEVDSRYFNQSPYLEKIGNFQDKVKNLEPAMQAPYQQAIGLSAEAAKRAPESFSGAVAARQNINQTMKDFLSDGGKAINPANRESKQFLGDLKNTLKNDVIDANASKIGQEATDAFKTQWEAANKSHQEVQKFYESFQNSTGKMKPTRQMRERFQNAVSTDPNLIGKFMPKLTDDGAKGIEGFKHLSKLYGDKTKAQDAAKAFLFQGQINNGAKTVDVAAQYAKMSDQQRKWLFGKSEEGRMLEAINNTRKAFEREPQKTLSKITHGVATWTVPGIIAGGASRYEGDSWEQSAVNAAAATVLSKGMGKIAGAYATPNSVNRAIDIGQYGKPMSGRYLNAIGQNFVNRRQDGQ